MDDHLLRFKKKQKFLIFDLETENLALVGKNRPWQCSYILATQDQILEEHDDFPWWSDLDVSPGAAQVTRFNWFSYKEKSSDPKKCLKRFEKLLLDPEILSVQANGLNYDTYPHNIWRNELGLSPDFSWQLRTYCIQSIEKSIILGQKDWPTDPYERLALQFRLSNIRPKGYKVNVKALCAKYGIPYDAERAHDGLYDVKLTKNVFFKQIWLAEI